MLEGKPSRQDDAATMSAIKSILSDRKNESVDTRSTERKPQPPRRATQETLTLTPVRDVEAKVRRATFTSVPTGYVPEEKIQILRSSRLLDAEEPEIGQSVSSQDDMPPPATKPQRKRARRATQRRTALPRLSVPTALRRASPRWAAIAVLFGCAMLYPAVIVFPLFVSIFSVIGAFVLFGSERVWRAVSRILTRYEARAPRKAARLMARLDAFAVHWDAILDRFPEGTVDGLYLPDFANHKERAVEQEAMLADRLERMHQQV